MTITTCIFDAYGTLFDVSSAAKQVALESRDKNLKQNWVQLAETWRLKQLQYTWLRAITGAHADFWQVTQDGLDWAMEAHGMDDPVLRDRLLQLYRELAAYPEVPAMLKALKSMRYTCAILSNGSPDMLGTAVGSAGIAEALDDVLSVENVGVFKPAHAVYDMVGARFNCTPDQVLFVSSNGWDAAGASGFGFNTVWVNRAGDPVDRLPWRPQHILRDLTDMPKLAQSL